MEVLGKFSELIGIIIHQKRYRNTTEFLCNRVANPTHEPGILRKTHRIGRDAYSRRFRPLPPDYDSGELDRDSVYLGWNLFWFLR